MPLMGSFYVGTSGLQTSQNALNTTAHNLSNIETTGYVRQQTLLGDRFYNNVGTAAISKQQVGLGVEYSKVRQVRDAFLDKSYRKESGRSSFYDICFETTSEMETLLGELEGASFSNALTNFWTSVEELKKDPTSAVVQGQFVTNAAQFLERAQAVYDGLYRFQDNLNSRVIDQVNQINEYGNLIHKYNLAIQKAEAGSEEANDLRDARNLALDKLSALGNITYSENLDGMVEVSFEGTQFVMRDMVFEMGVKIDTASGFSNPVWPHNENAPVFSNLDREVSSALETDVGELRAILLARGDRRANYTDLLTDRTIDGQIFDVYRDGYLKDTTNPRAGRYMATSKSLCLTVEAEFDQMIHSIVTEINNILTGEKKAIDGGILPQYDDSPDQKMELFVRLGTPRYKKVTVGGDTKYQYVTEDTENSPADVSTMYTTNNLKINPDLLKTPTALSFLTDDNKADQAKADALADAFSAEFSALNPDTTKKYKYKDFYSAMLSQIGNAGGVYKSISKSQEETVASLEDSRQAVMGVSSNEELTNMIKFQNAYNASSRYINVVNEMLATIIERLG